jgi:hypothetical protein
VLFDQNDAVRGVSGEGVTWRSLLAHPGLDEPQARSDHMLDYAAKARPKIHTRTKTWLISVISSLLQPGRPLE